MFEPSRLEQACLQQAYALLVPVLHRSLSRGMPAPRRRGHTGPLGWCSSSLPFCLWGLRRGKLRLGWSEAQVATKDGDQRRIRLLEAFVLQPTRLKHAHYLQGWARPARWGRHGIPCSPVGMGLRWGKYSRAVLH